MPDILKRDFTEESHCGRCERGRTPLQLGIAYFFRDVGPARYAGPTCARRDADNWGLFPDFTRAFASTARELEEGLAAAREFNGAVANQAVRDRVQLRAVLEYLGLRAKLGLRFSAFPCLNYLRVMQERVEAGDALTESEIRAVLSTAKGYGHVNPRATPGALQECYALDILLDRLIAEAGPLEILVGIQSLLRRHGCLSVGRRDAIARWLDARGMPVPSTRSIIR